MIPIQSCSTTFRGLQWHNSTKTHHNDIIYEIYDHGQWSWSTFNSLNKYTTLCCTHAYHVQELPLQPTVTVAPKDTQKSENVLFLLFSPFKLNVIFLHLFRSSSEVCPCFHIHAFPFNPMTIYQKGIFDALLVWNKSNLKKAKITLRLSTWWSRGLWKVPLAKFAWVLDTVEIQPLWTAHVFAK